MYLVVPVDRRLVRLARAWANSEEQDRHQAAEESVRVSHARARALERIAGAAAPKPEESDDLLKRLARAEAGVAVPWRRVVRALEACDGGKLQKALIRLRLSRLSPRPEDRAAVVEVFRHDFDALTAAAQQTLWPIVLDVRREGTDRVVDLCERIEDLPQVSVSEPAHAQEHSLEVELPFLQEVLGDGFSLLPLVVGVASADSVAEVLERVWTELETLVVISSDLSHFLSYDQAARRDAETADRILELDASLATERACGAIPINGLLLAARRRGLTGRLLDLRNSGDTAGDRSRVVGYGAFEFGAPA